MWDFHNEHFQANRWFGEWLLLKGLNFSIKLF